MVGGEFIVYNTDTGWQVLGRAGEPDRRHHPDRSERHKEAAGSTANDKIIELDKPG